MSPSEQVKIWLSQTLTRYTHFNSNSRSEVLYHPPHLSRTDVMLSCTMFKTEELRKKKMLLTMR